MLFQGTYWYHSHFKAQYCDGLRGVLIIDDPNDPQKYLYDVDNGEKHIWNGVHGAEISSRRHRYHSRGLVSLSFDGSSRDPVSLKASVGTRDGDYICSAFNSTLINGKGNYPGSSSNVSLAVMNVQQGLRSVLYLFCVWVYFDFSHYISYRFRLVSISCDPSFNFSIDSHQMTIIEVDGVNTQPLLVDSIQIFAGACGLIQFPSVLIEIDVKTGQRYSIVVCPFCSLFIGGRISSVCRSTPARRWLTTVSFSFSRYFVVSQNTTRDSFSSSGSELQRL